MNLTGTTRIRTTAYHPIANGMVERFHRQLKASLKCQNNLKWTEALPLVLLGIRTAYKDDLTCSAAELVYGTTIRLPGEYFDESNTSTTPADYITSLRDKVRELKVVEPRVAPRRVYADKDLSSSTHVFVRHDAVRKPLQRPYNGPYRVISRGDKQYKLAIKGREEVISVDRLKPAHVDNTCDAEPRHKADTAYTSQQSSKTNVAANTTTSKIDTTSMKGKLLRSGRRVHFPEGPLHTVRSFTAFTGGE